ncbi:MAG: ribose 5-phosphate isomerase B [Bacteroidota bacterium]|nr:ribose 5-phosphate isomerase B [Bacteroidota bacterium]
MMNIAIGGDHAGFEYKEVLITWLKEQGNEVKDFGPFSNDSCDYSDFAHPLAQAVANKTYNMGILICGSGNGVCITANKHKDARAALCWEVELARLARMHNDANIIGIPARFVDIEKTKQMIQMFMDKPFEGGRHQNRVNKINI